MKKAVAAVLLAVLLVCAVFSSCGKKEDGAVTGNGNTTRSAAQNAVTNAGDAVGDAVTGAGDVVGDHIGAAGHLFGNRARNTQIGGVVHTQQHRRKPVRVV